MCIPKPNSVFATVLFLILATGFGFAAPTINSFTPTSGTIGNQVTITGSGFSGATAVTFHGIKAVKYSVNSDTKITATVPISASTGLLKVTAAGSTAASATNFTVTPGMAFSFGVGSPNSKPTLYGVGFHATNAVDVYFDSQDVALLIASATGTISTIYQIPLSAQPGQHWFTFVERGSNWGAQKPFTVQTNWAQHGFGPANSGANPYENTIDTTNVGTLKTEWSGTASAFDLVSPFVVAGGSVFVGEAAGIIRAYSADTGALLWTASPGGDMKKVNPVAAMGRVFFGDANGDVRSYSQTCRSDGGVCTPQWTANITTEVTAGLTFFKGTLYVPSADGSIHTLDPTTGVAGTPIYAHDTSHGAVTTPIAFDADGSFFYAAGTDLQFSIPPIPGVTLYA
jgi:outer membrane protein assembly factor BamB